MFPPFLNTVLTCCCSCLGGKVVFSDTAQGTSPIFRNILKSSSFCNTVIGITCIGIVNITADFAYILCH